MINKNNKSLLTGERVDEPVHFSGGLIARNTLYNLLGYVLPMLVAIITIPIIVRELGTERFGVLTLAWMLVGYFSLFDMGLGRATTKFVAEYLAVKNTDKATHLIWASMAMLMVLGIIGTIAALLIVPWLVHSVLNIPEALQDETRKAFYLLAFSIPFVLSTASARGVLEAQQRFRLINSIKIPSYVAGYAAPLLVLPFTNSLFPVVAVLIASRLAAFVAYLYYCFKSIPGLKQPRIPGLNVVKKLFCYGGWLTLSNLIWPVMVYLDRFIIGTVLTMSAVAYYVTPHELVAKLLIVSGSLLAVVFPVFSAYAGGRHEELIGLHNKAVKYLILILTPVVASIIVLAYPFFNLWLGEDFAVQSSPILQLLAIGILISSISQIPSSALQAMGRPDITAKLHAIELPLYLITVWFLIQSMGIVGAALAWVLRVMFDGAMSFLLFYRLSPKETRKPPVSSVTLVFWPIVYVTTGYILSRLSGIFLKGGLLLMLTVIMILLSWRVCFDYEEKSYIRGIAARLLKWRIGGLEPLN